MKNYKITYLTSMPTDIMTWHDIGDRVSIIMVNNKLLESHGNPVYTSYWDLAMVYAIEYETRSEMRLYMLKQEDLDNLGIDKGYLHSTAIRNTLAKRRFRIAPLLEVIDHTMFAPLAIPKPSTMMEANGVHSQKVILDVNPMTGEENILSCTIKGRPFGAAYMFLPSVLETVHKRFNGQEFYILPVSMHEVWFIKNSYVSHNGKKNYKDIGIDLLDLLEEYNDTYNTNWQDILSYNLYYYLGSTNDEGQVIMPISN